MRVIAIDALKREIEKRFCDGCRSKDYEEFKVGYCCEMVEDTMNFIDTLPTTESESDKDWISVKDRLPDDDVRLIDANSVCKKIVKSIRCAEEWANEAKKQQDTHGLRCATEAKTSLLAMLARIHDEPTIEAEPVNGWISVKDRLSEPYTMVLVHDTDGKIFTVIYKNDHIQFITGYTITHWQPLPEPPKGE